MFISERTNFRVTTFHLFGLCAISIFLHFPVFPSATDAEYSIIVGTDAFCMSLSFKCIKNFILISLYLDVPIRYCALLLVVQCSVILLLANGVNSLLPYWCFSVYLILKIRFKYLLLIKDYIFSVSIYLYNALSLILHVF